LTKKKRRKKKKKKAVLTFKDAFIPPPAGSRYTVFHQNANGLRARLLDGSFVRALTEEDADVFVFTESRCTRKQFFRLFSQKVGPARPALSKLVFDFCVFYATRPSLLDR
jgi:hypothetical protein